MRDFVDDKKLNRKLNYAILLLEFLFIVYAINTVYGCPCAYRTCGIKHFDVNTHEMDWEASNLDCKFVQDYIARNQFMGRDDTPNMNGLNDGIDLQPSEKNYTLGGGIQVLELPEAAR